jgi:hypothetical protein
MSVFHGVRDITKLEGRTFFKLAWRLLSYEGAFLNGVVSKMEEIQTGAEGVPVRPREPENRAMSAEELGAWDPGPNPGLGFDVGIFEHVKAT